MKRNAIVLIVVALTVSLMIFVTARRSRDAALGGDKLIASSENIGKAAPEFELTSLEGKTVKLSDYKGRPLLINFWATWCGPCKIEMPWFIEFKKKYEAQGFEIVGIAMEDTETDKIQEFVKKMGVNYMIVRGKNAVADAYGDVQGFPTSFYLDREGRVVAQHAGLVSKDTIENDIKLALGEKTAEGK